MSRNITPDNMRNYDRFKCWGLVTIRGFNMNDKQITKLTSKWKPKCDQHDGEYDSNGNVNLAVTTVKLTYDEMFKIDESEELQKIINDENFNIDPTWVEKTGQIQFRLKKLCEWNVEKFYNSIDDDTRQIMVGKQHHVNQQHKTRESLKQKLNFIKENRVSKAIMSASEKLAKHMNISVEEAMKIIS